MLSEVYWGYVAKGWERVILAANNPNGGNNGMNALNNSNSGSPYQLTHSNSVGVGVSAFHIPPSTIVQAATIAPNSNNSTASAHGSSSLNKVRFGLPYEGLLALAVDARIIKQQHAFGGLTSSSTNSNTFAQSTLFASTFGSNRNALNAAAVGGGNIMSTVTGGVVGSVCGVGGALPTPTNDGSLSPFVITQAAANNTSNNNANGSAPLSPTAGHATSGGGLSARGGSANGAASPRSVRFNLGNNSSAANTPSKKPQQHHLQQQLHQQAGAFRPSSPAAAASPFSFASFADPTPAAAAPAIDVTLLPHVFSAVDPTLAPSSSSKYAQQNLSAPYSIPLDGTPFSYDSLPQLSFIAFVEGLIRLACALRPWVAFGTRGPSAAAAAQANGSGNGQYPEPLASVRPGSGLGDVSYSSGNGSGYSVSGENSGGAVLATGVAEAFFAFLSTDLLPRATRLSSRALTAATAAPAVAAVLGGSQQATVGSVFETAAESARIQISPTSYNDISNNSNWVQFKYISLPGFLKLLQAAGLLSNGTGGANASSNAGFGFGNGTNRMGPSVTGGGLFSLAATTPVSLSPSAPLKVCPLTEAAAVGLYLRALQLPLDGSRPPMLVRATFPPLLCAIAEAVMPDPFQALANKLETLLVAHLMPVVVGAQQQQGQQR